jgi:hypothetical protein
MIPPDGRAGWPWSPAALLRQSAALLQHIGDGATDVMRSPQEDL